MATSDHGFVFSLLPAIVAVLFLGYGIYVVANRGFNRVSASFFLLCISTFCWQAAWAVLFQVRDPQWADVLIRLGYLLILFLPTSLYQFLAEITEQRGERRWVRISYGVAALMGLLDVGTNIFVSGYYDYFWGYYPKAGPLHPLHVLQTVAVVGRGLYITLREQKAASPDRKIRLRLCIASVFIYLFAAVDYLCNYGFEFYPPGVVFIAISLGLIMIAVTRYSLMSPVALAATMAHEMRTPLASIRIQADILSRLLPEVQRLCQIADSREIPAGAGSTPGLATGSREMSVTHQLAIVSRGIEHQVARSNVMINMLLASSRMEHIDPSTFGIHSIRACIDEAVSTYPFARNERSLISVNVREDFAFHGSDSLMVYVLFNLLKNSLHSIKSAGKGSIEITADRLGGTPVVRFRDTGTGISASTLPRIFEPFFTTKKSSGAGIGLAFCDSVLSSFGGRIACESIEHQHTTFTMRFPDVGGKAPPTPSALAEAL